MYQSTHILGTGSDVILTFMKNTFTIGNFKHKTHVTKKYLFNEAKVVSLDQSEVG